ncbi:uncharacterized protein LOC142348003 [Convolutriloba macropyga]|uniref:uncharacterized protein LOC142348003 n=1 Tax=Convolutriloba macropyga TaxID=536237 RepID=UPI003F522338
MKGVITHRENDGKLVFANVMSFDLYDEVRSMAEHAHETLRVGLGTLEPYIRYRHLLKCDGKEVTVQTSSTSKPNAVSSQKLPSDINAVSSISFHIASTEGQTSTSHFDTFHQSPSTRTLSVPQKTSEDIAKGILTKSAAPTSATASSTIVYESATSTSDILAPDNLLSTPSTTDQGKLLSTIKEKSSKPIFSAPTKSLLQKTTNVFSSRMPSVVPLTSQHDSSNLVSEAFTDTTVTDSSTTSSMTKQSIPTVTSQSNLSQNFSAFWAATRNLSPPKTTSHISPIISAAFPMTSRVNASTFESEASSLKAGSIAQTATSVTKFTVPNSVETSSNPSMVLTSAVNSSASPLFGSTSPMTSNMQQKLPSTNPVHPSGKYSVSNFGYTKPISSGTQLMMSLSVSTVRNPGLIPGVKTASTVHMDATKITTRSVSISSTKREKMAQTLQSLTSTSYETGSTKKQRSAVSEENPLTESTTASVYGSSTNNKIGPSPLSELKDLRLNFTNTATFVEKHLDILVAHILIVTTVLIVATMCCYIYRV